VTSAVFPDSEKRSRIPIVGLRSHRTRNRKMTVERGTKTP
jgi:hypothetical protein